MYTAFDFQLPTRSLSECGVDEGHLGKLAADAVEQWTRQFNPRDAGQSELNAIYRQAF